MYQHSLVQVITTQVGHVLVRRIGGTIIWCLRAVRAGLAVSRRIAQGGRSRYRGGHRHCEPGEIAPAIAWLLGPEASYVTGAVLRVAEAYRASFGGTPGRPVLHPAAPEPGQPGTPSRDLISV